MSNHPISHIEISSNNREESAQFYNELFGWPARQIPEMNYATMNPADGGPSIGLNPVNEENPAGTVTFYVHTDDIDASLSKAQSLGAKVLSPKMEIPTVGWFAVFSDPTGNAVALLQPLPMS